MQIYLARHGQNEDNANGILNGHRDLPLTDLGREQAHQLGEGIKGKDLVFDELYSSPLRRAIETALIIGDSLGLRPPVIDPDLIERDFGILTGRPLADIERVCGDRVLKTDTITYFLDPPNAETFPELLVRAARFLARLRQRHKQGESILIVAHGDLGKMLYASFYGLDWQQCLTQFHFGNSELLLLSDDSSAEDAHVVRIPQYNH